jgi:hypothetical protein
MDDETEDEKDPRKELHNLLQHAVLLIASGLPFGVGTISTDTALAIGEAMGAVRKAKALVGRDIDDAEQRKKP